MTTLHASRRAVIGALAALPAIAAPAALANTTTSSAAWDATMARYLKLKTEAAQFDDEVYWPIHRKVEALRPSYVLRHVAENGRVGTYSVTYAEMDDPASEAPYEFLHDQYEEMREQHLRYAGLRKETNWDAINEQIDATSEMLADLQGELIQMPAPHMEALEWKMRHLFTPEPRDPECLPTWELWYVQPFLDDVRRLGGAA